MGIGDLPAEQQLLLYRLLAYPGIARQEPETPLCLLDLIKQKQGGVADGLAGTLADGRRPLQGMLCAKGCATDCAPGRPGQPDGGRARSTPLFTPPVPDHVFYSLR